MKQLLAALALSLLSIAAHAQPAALDQLYEGYHPTVFKSYQEVVNAIDSMPLGFKMGGGLARASQCYQRAELWSYNFYRNEHVNVMKVFIFYTHTYRRAYNFDWWFHVAPYVLMRNPSTQQLEEYVLDPVFSDTPLAMKPWSDLFLESHKKCAEFVPYELFRDEVEMGNPKYGTEHCYLMRVPATDYDPTDVDARSAGRKSGYNWGHDELEQAVSNAPTARMRGWWRAQLGL